MAWKFWRCSWWKPSAQIERESDECIEIERKPSVSSWPPQQALSRDDVIAVAEQAELRRKEGNLCFKNERIGAAIDAYTEAIALCPKVPVYWTNRAICHMKQKDWAKLEEDCTRALQLDNSSVKAHYMMGVASTQRHEYAKAVKELDKALQLCANPKGCRVDQIRQELAKAKYLDWEDASSQQSWRLQCLKEECEEALKVQYALENSQPDITNTTPNTLMDQLKTLEQVFSKAAEDVIPTEVPDYLCCKITFDILRDPVVTPSGITYEREALVQHLLKVGKFDPVTREPLQQLQLVPNLVIKKAVQAFLKDHGWAYKTD